jgi:hypothetical protein
MLKGKHFSDFADIKSFVGEKKLTGIPVQNFKNYFEQWPMHWKHCRKLEGDYSKKF